MLAGIHVGFAVILLVTIGGVMAGNGAARVVMGVSFGIALSLVMLAGSDLFTGSNLVMASGYLSGNVGWRDVLRVWVVCHIGNWAGSILLAVIYRGTGLASGVVGDFIISSVSAKMGYPPLQLITKGILCNMLVCLGVWCGYRCKSESGKLIMIFWCVYAFITSGFEHSVANMTMLTIGMLMSHGESISAAGYFYNIFLVTAGNIIGGVLFVAAPYFIIAGRKPSQTA
jgi:nitrite transporter NirC